MMPIENHGSMDVNAAAADAIRQVLQVKLNPSFDQAREAFLDDNIIDGYFPDTHTANAFIAANLDEADTVVQDHEMNMRYGARLNPFMSPKCFCDAMIEFSALRIIDEIESKTSDNVLKSSLLPDSDNKEPVACNVMRHNAEEYSRLVSIAADEMRGYLKYTGSFDMLALDRTAFGYNAAHSSPEQAALFLLENKSNIEPDLFQEIKYSREFFTDPIHVEARAIADSAKNIISHELYLNGIDINSPFAISNFYTNSDLLNSLDDAISEADSLKQDAAGFPGQKERSENGYELC